MVHYATLWPDPADDSQSPKAFNAGNLGNETTYPLAFLTRTFAAHGAGTVSADLALDLILNDIVDQACLTTGAAGAAVALVREGEMVCRAATGTGIPDLGVPLDAHSGLSGACMESGELQLCLDTERDSRADAETCRRLGIRSILVLPVVDEEELLGILEVVSPYPNVFGEFDVQNLKFLAGQIVHNRRRAYETDRDLIAPLVTIEPLVPAQEVKTGESPDQSPKPGFDGGGGRGLSKAKKTTDSWTIVLGVLVISVAILLGALVGWRLGWRKAAMGNRVSSSRPVAVSKVNPTVPPTSDGQQQVSSPSAKSPAPTTEETNPAVKRSGVGVTKSSAEPPLGGLVIYERGKVIYRTPPSEPENRASLMTNEVPPPREIARGKTIVSNAGAAGTVEVSGEVAEARLIHRVEPRYPSDARQQRLQGPVVLDVHVSPEGKVRTVSVLSGNPQFADAAMQAVRQWQYQPYVVGGQPVEMQTRITVNFALPPQ